MISICGKENIKHIASVNAARASVWRNLSFIQHPHIYLPVCRYLSNV